jgi:hypothetical protein
MKFRLLSAIVVAAFFAGAACAQDSGSAAPTGQNSVQGPGGGYGRGGRGGGMGMGGPGMGMTGRGLTGTVTEVAADHYTIKTDVGEMYTVKFTSGTRIMKQGAGMRGPAGGRRVGEGGGQGNGGGMGMGGGRGNPPQQIKASDVKVGDVVGVMGNTDAATKTVSASAIMQMDPERVKAMHEMEANFGKTWLMGKVTAIDGAKITLTGSVDSAPHSVVADENTTFRKRRDPITLADVQVGDSIRVDGNSKDGVFTATSVSVMGGMMGGETPTVPRNAPPQ